MESDCNCAETRTDTAEGKVVCTSYANTAGNEIPFEDETCEDRELLLINRTSRHLCND